MSDDLKNKFLATYKLKISTLSPVHIGCGKDYEPYEYLEDGQDIVAFTSEQLMSVIPPAERDQLIWAAMGDRPLQAVKEFITKYKTPLCGLAGVRRTPKLAQRPKEDTARFPIERSFLDPQTGAAVLPGSSLKGALRTAWLDAKPKLLKVDISTDPLRLLAVTDAFAANDARAIMGINRVHKSPHSYPGSDTSVSSKLKYFLEVIKRGGEFEAELTLRQADKKIQISDPIPSIAELTAAVNWYYLRELYYCKDYIADMKNSAHQKYGGEWLEWIASEFDNDEKVDPNNPAKKSPTLGGWIRKNQTENNHYFLLRIGKHSGAESITLEERRNIKVKYKAVSDFPLSMTLTRNDPSKPETAEPFGWIFVRLERVV
jgi:CRISPR-associated protein Csm5